MKLEQWSGKGNGSPLQCSCLENPRDGRAWWAAIYGVAQSWTRQATQQQPQNSSHQQISQGLYTAVNSNDTNPLSEIAVSLHRLESPLMEIFFIESYCSKVFPFFFFLSLAPVHPWPTLEVTTVSSSSPTKLNIQHKVKQSTFFRLALKHHLCSPKCIIMMMVTAIVY